MRKVYMTSQTASLLMQASGSRIIDLICFLSRWYKRPINQAPVLFALVYAYGVCLFFTIFFIVVFDCVLDVYTADHNVNFSVLVHVKLSCHIV